MDVSLVLTTANLILKHVNTREVNKYRDKIIKLERVMREERNKPSLDRDQIKFAAAYYELRDLLKTLNSTPAPSNSINSSK